MGVFRTIKLALALLIFGAITINNAKAALIVPDALGLDDSSFRIAAPVPMSIELEEWVQLTSGDYELELFAPQAGSLAVYFSTLRLGTNGKIWFSNEAGDVVQGPYRQKDIPVSGRFWSPHIAGERLRIRVTSANEALAADIATVYRGKQKSRATSGIQKTYGGSQPGDAEACHREVQCAEGDQWQDEARAVIKYELMGQFSCSATLMNNTANDGRALFLSALHCFEETGVSPNVAAESVNLVFNYQSPACGMSLFAPPQRAKAGGVIIRAQYQPTDMVLFEYRGELSQFDSPYWAGWDIREALPSGVVSIHHPGGDVKAISTSCGQTDFARYGALSPFDGYLRVPGWQTGSTEGGSSGAALLNVDHLVIGQLHGGSASCAAPQLPDYYGRLAVAWYGGGTANTRLKDWLDPKNLNVETFTGADIFAGTTGTSGAGLGVSCAEQPSVGEDEAAKHRGAELGDQRAEPAQPKSGGGAFSCYIVGLFSLLVLFFRLRQSK